MKETIEQHIKKYAKNIIKNLQGSNPKDTITEETEILLTDLICTDFYDGFKFQFYWMSVKEENPHEYSPIIMTNGNKNDFIAGTYIKGNWYRYNCLNFTKVEKIPEEFKIKYWKYV